MTDTDLKKCLECGILPTLRTYPDGYLYRCLECYRRSDLKPTAEEAAADWNACMKDGTE